MSIKSKAKKIGKAILFKKLYNEFIAKKERRDIDISILIEHIEEWKAENPDDMNCALASILVKAQDASPEEIEEEVNQAKEQYTTEDEELIPWFECQIQNATSEDKKEE